MVGPGYGSESSGVGVGVGGVPGRVVVVAAGVGIVAEGMRGVGVGLTAPVTAGVGVGVPAVTNLEGTRVVM